MADSIREKILANIVTTLQGIEAGVTYNTTIPDTRIFRSTQGVPHELHYPSVLIGASDAPDSIMSGSVVDRSLIVTIQLIAGAGGLTLAKNVELYVADIQRAMAADYSRGGNAFDQDEPEIDEPDFSEIFQDHANVTIRYRIRYRVLRTDPTLP